MCMEVTFSVIIVQRDPSDLSLLHLMTTQCKAILEAVICKQFNL